jgi:carboxymethylenebutenolidase
MPTKQKQTSQIYTAVPASGKGPGVLVIHAWWGLNEFFKGLCERLAAEGFVAAAPDLFEGEVATTPAMARKLRGKPRKQPAYKTLLHAIEELQANPAVQGQKIALVGFSMGAHWALWLAARPELPIAATVFFYGSRACDFSASQSAFQGHFAETDEWVSQAARKKLEKELVKSAMVAEFHCYPGTGHWFFESDRADAYNGQAAEAAWGRMISFLKLKTMSK